MPTGIDANANANSATFGLSGSTPRRAFMANISLNRKVLAHLAVSDPDAFGAVVEVVKAADS